MRFDSDAAIMQRALELAAGGIGFVEPNPPVGAVVVDAERTLLGEGRHERFGGPHAEVHALAAAGEAARGATLFVTLEPCCHEGRTPPCTRAVIDAGIARVVAAVGDPAPHNGGRGFRALREAGIDVEVGLLVEAAAALIAPFTKLHTTGLPWVHAKWATTLDGRIATRSGHSRWISGEVSRRRVHELRGRMDAILVGAGTVRADDPQLTARPPGPRTATRVVLDSRAALPATTTLVTTARAVPVLVFATEAARDSDRQRLAEAGVDVVVVPPSRAGVDPRAVMEELGRRRFMHVLVEGGGEVLGSLFDARLVDEAHVFVAPTIVGGRDARSPVLGTGVADLAEASRLRDPQWEPLGEDLYLTGRVSNG